MAWNVSSLVMGAHASGLLLKVKIFLVRGGIVTIPYFTSIPDTSSQSSRWITALGGQWLTSKSSKIMPLEKSHWLSWFRWRTIVASGSNALANCVLPRPVFPHKNNTFQFSGMSGALEKSVAFLGATVTLIFLSRCTVRLLVRLSIL